VIRLPEWAHVRLDRRPELDGFDVYLVRDDDDGRRFAARLTGEGYAWEEIQPGAAAPVALSIPEATMSALIAEYVRLAPVPPDLAKALERERALSERLLSLIEDAWPALLEAATETEG
jgi:hypothetical protein